MKIYSISLFLLFTAVGTCLYANEKGEAGVDAALSSGVSLVDLEGATYETKAMPTAGFSLLPYVAVGHIVSFGAELSYYYTFKSNYRNYYYYNSYKAVTFLPNITLHIKYRRYTWIVYSGIGGGYLFSDSFHKFYTKVTLGTGIFLKNKLLKGIFLSYDHSFIAGYRSFETLKVYFSFHVWDNKKQSE